MRERIGNLVFFSGITLILYFMFWVDMWLHLVVGGGYYTMFSSIGFWGTSQLLESVYMNHLTLFMVGVALTVFGAFLLPKYTPSTAFTTSISAVVYLNSLWGIIWFILELGLPSDMWTLFVEAWGSRYYAWAIHPFLPTLWWERPVILALSAFGVAWSIVGLIAPDKLTPMTTISLSAITFGALTLTGNIRLDAVYVALGVTLTLSAVFLLTSLRKPKQVVSALLIASALLLLGFASGYLAPTQTQIPTVYHNGYFTAEHLPPGIYVAVPYGEPVPPIPLPAITEISITPILLTPLSDKPVLLTDMKSFLTVDLTYGALIPYPVDVFIYSQHPFNLYKLA